MVNIAGRMEVLDTPFTYDQFYSRLTYLGNEAIIDVTLSTYTFRRLAANAVNRPEVSAEDRRLLMKHNLQSRIFRAYISRTTQFDIQGRENHAALAGVGTADAWLQAATSCVGCRQSRSLCGRGHQRADSGNSQGSRSVPDENSRT